MKIFTLVCGCGDPLIAENNISHDQMIHVFPKRQLAEIKSLEIDDHNGNHPDIKEYELVEIQ